MPMNKLCTIKLKAICEYPRKMDYFLETNVSILPKKKKKIAWIYELLIMDAFSMTTAH